MADALRQQMAASVGIRRCEGTSPLFLLTDDLIKTISEKAYRPIETQATMAYGYHTGRALHAGLLWTDEQLALHANITGKCAICTHAWKVKDTRPVLGPDGKPCLDAKGKPRKEPVGTFSLVQKASLRYPGFMICPASTRALAPILCWDCVAKHSTAKLRVVNRGELRLGDTPVLRQDGGMGPWRQLWALDLKQLGTLKKAGSESRAASTGAACTKRRLPPAKGPVGKRPREAKLLPPVRPRECPTPLTTALVRRQGINDPSRLQAKRFIQCVVDGTAFVWPEGLQDGRAVVLHCSNWDAKGRGTLRPIGMPDGKKALPATVYWDPNGRPACSCPLGRLDTQAVCVHKLFLVSFSARAVGTRLPAPHELNRQGNHMEVLEIPRSTQPLESQNRVPERAQPLERVFAIKRNVHTGPARNFVIQTGRDRFFCSGKRESSCTRNCKHVQLVREALKEARVFHPARPLTLTQDEAEAAAERVRGVSEWLPRLSEVPREAPPRVFDEQTVQHVRGLAVAEDKGGVRECRPGCECRDRLEFREGSEEALESAAQAVKMCAEPPPVTDVERGERGYASRRGKGFDAHPKVDLFNTAEQPAEAFEEGSVPVCVECVGVCGHGEGGPSQSAPVLSLFAKGVQRTVPRVLRADEQVHDPVITALRNPLRSSQMGYSDFKDLGARGRLLAPCPKAPPPCLTTWRLTPEKGVTIYDAQWTLETQVYHYTCDCEKRHTVHFDGEHLKLYTHSRGIILTQRCCETLLAGLQGGSNFSRQSDLFKGVSSKFGPSPRLDEGRLREAAMGYFALKQKYEEPRCCSLCGPHPQYLICDGLFGLANKDGSERKGGIASTTQSGRASFTHPDRSKRDGMPFQKTRTAGVHYSGVSPGGPYTVRRVVPEDNLRRLLARLSQHRPSAQHDPDEGANNPLTRGQPLSAHEYYHVLLTSLEQKGHVEMRRLVEGIEAEAEAGHSPGEILRRFPERWKEIMYDLNSHDEDCKILQTERSLRVARRILLGERVTEQDRLDWGEDSPILRRLLDSYEGRLPSFFMGVLKALYKSSIYGRGGVAYPKWTGESWRVFHEASWWCGHANRPPPDPEGIAAAHKAMEALERFSLDAELLGEAERELLVENLGVTGPALEDFASDGEDLCWYPFWEKKRPLPFYAEFEAESGRSKTAEARCAGNVFVDNGRSTLPHTRGLYVWCCPHRVLYGIHIMLRGESPRDPFAVLYTRFNRDELPRVLINDCSCSDQNYCFRREPTFFSNVRFVIDKFHYGKAEGEIHLCGPTNSSHYYSLLTHVNTSACESVNSFLNRFTTIGWFSKLENMMILLPLLITAYNAELSRVDDHTIRTACRRSIWTFDIRDLLFLQF